jgi:hypothetical protein
MPIQHKKPFGVYHRDTFDNETFLITKDWNTGEKAEFDTLEEAEKFVAEHYKGRIGNNGADQVDIVNLDRDIVRKFAVG